MRRPDPLIVLTVLVTTLIIVWTANLAGQIGHPFEGFVRGGTVFNRAPFLESSTPSWWHMIRTHHMAYGDLLWSLDGIAYRQADAIWQRLGQGGTASLQFERDGSRQTLTVLLVPFTFNQFVDLKFPNLLMPLCLLIIAVEILRTDPTSSKNRKLVLICLMFSYVFGTDRASLNFSGDIFTHINEVISYYTMPFCVVILIQFIYSELTPPDNLARYVQSGVVIVFCIVAVAITLVYSGWLMGLYWDWVYTWVVQLEFMLIGSAPLLVIARLLQFIWCSRHDVVLVQQRRVVLTLLLGFLLALPLPVMTTIINIISSGNAFFLQQFDMRYLWLSPVVALAGAMLRYQTFGVSSRAMILVPLLMVSAVGASAINMLYWTIVPTNLPTELPSVFLPSFGILVVVSVLGVSRPFFQRTMASLWYKERNAFEDVAIFSSYLLQQSRLTHSSQAITDTLAHQYGLIKVELWFQVKPPNQFRRLSATPIALTSSEKYAAPLFFGDTPLRLNPSVDHQDLQALIPLRFEDTLYGWIGVGARRDGELLLNVDLEALSIIGRQLTLFLYALQGKSHLQQINNALHDTTQQFLHQLTFELPLLEAHMSTNKGTFFPNVQRLTEEVIENAQVLRDIMMGKLQRDLSDVSLLVERYAAKNLHVVWCNHTDNRVNPAMQQELFFWIKELLHNTWKYAHATQAEVRLRLDDTLVLSVKDNGVGCDNYTWRQPMGGLHRIEQRVISVNGSLTVLHDEGTKIVIQLPKILAETLL